MTATVCLHILSMIRTRPFSLESCGLTVASLKTFDNSAGCKVLNFQRQIQRQLCRKGRWILLKGETKGLKRHGVTLFSLVRMPQNTVNALGTALLGGLCLPHGEKSCTFKTHFTSNGCTCRTRNQETRDSRAVNVGMTGDFQLTVNVL